MEYLILAKDDRRILFISDTLDYQENGNYLINDGTLAIPPTICELAEVDNVPDDVVPELWCYVDGQFVPNPNPPAPPPENDVDYILDIIKGQREVAENV